MRKMVISDDSHLPHKKEIIQTGLKTILGGHRDGKVLKITIFSRKLHRFNRKPY